MFIVIYFKVYIFEWNIDEIQVFGLLIYEYYIEIWNYFYFIMDNKKVYQYNYVLFIIKFDLYVIIIF